MTKTSEIVAASLTAIMAAPSFQEGYAEELLSSAAKSMHGTSRAGSEIGLEEAKEYLRMVRASLHGMCSQFLYHRPFCSDHGCL